MLKIDLHTHSVGSPDGGIKPEQYARILEDGTLDYVAVTDHDRIDIAEKIQDMLGDKVIIGQEITTVQGELIGLFLKKAVRPGQTALETAKAIKNQGGLVYVPHPFETVRKGLSKETLEALAAMIDIIEVHNGRAVFQNRGPEAATWARISSAPMAASSDAHGYKGLGTTYTLITDAPTAGNLPDQLMRARFTTNRPPLRTLLYPKLHRLRKKVSNR
jgi:predicted metal-dependent phosphoesterase TrpH